MIERLSKTERPNARLILIHGMGDHSRALPYNLFSEYFLNRGFEIYRFDLPGHGELMAKKMYVKNWEDLYRSCDPAVSAAAANNDGIPVFITGLSLGGLIALNYAAVFPGKLAGVIAASPALDTGGAPVVLQKILGILSGISPKLQIDLKLNLQNISRDEQAVKQYTGDKYWQTKTTTGFAASVLEGIRHTHRLADSLKLPVLLLQGSADSIVPPAGGKKYYEMLKTKNKKLVEYPGFYHNLFLEPGREQVFADIENWIKNCVLNAG